MPVENRLDMELTGIKTPLGLKIQGPNVEGILQVGAQVQQILSPIPAMRSIFAERVSQGFYLNIEVILQKLLGYNFSVAVWVGYIALFGIAVATGVVMVLYLHEALDHRLKSGVPLRHEDIEAAVIEGAVHRLRPKLMTVCVMLASTVLRTFDNSYNPADSIQRSSFASAFGHCKDSSLCLRFSMFSIISGICFSLEVSPEAPII